jgi:hypothetical protein
VPRTSCWRHEGLRSGFEVAFLSQDAGGVTIRGTTSGLQDGKAWVVGYSLRLDPAWCTRRARVVTETAQGRVELVLESDGSGRWAVDGIAAPVVEGCFDVDLESSAVTNALPVHRLSLGVGEAADAAAVYVRASGGDIGRLEQRYLRLDDHAQGQRYDYEAPAFDFRCVLEYDRSGLVLGYPGIATRAG